MPRPACYGQVGDYLADPPAPPRPDQSSDALPDTTDPTDGPTTPSHTPAATHLPPRTEQQRPATATGRAVPR